MGIEGTRTRRIALLWLLPLGTLAILLATTSWVLASQVQYQHFLQQRHTEDICTQAARRLELFINSQLSMCTIFARAWAGEEGTESTEEDFEEFATVLLQELSGIDALGLFDPSGQPRWAVQGSAGSLEAYMLAEGRPWFDLAPDLGGLVVSDPVELTPGLMSFVAVQRVIEDGIQEGFLVAAFQIDELVQDTFRGAIGREFDYILEDKDEALFHVGNNRFPGTPGGAWKLHASEKIVVGNRLWELHVAPRADVAPERRVKSVLLVYGLLLSFGLSVTVGLLTRRMFELERSRSRHHLAEGRKTELARGILRVQEEERLRLSRELHDELGQLLTGIRVELDVIRRTDSSSSCGDSTYEAMYRLVDMALDSVRRLCRGLRPPALDDLGLVAACRQLTGEFASRSHIELDLQIGPNLDSLRLPGEIGVTFYRVLQESLTNVSRHSRATQVKVSLHRDHDELVLTVADDGKGFDPDSLTGRDGMGLVGMRERSRLIDGNLVLHSDRHAGTRITFRAPI